MTLHVAAQVHEMRALAPQGFQDLAVVRQHVLAVGFYRQELNGVIRQIAARRARFEPQVGAPGLDALDDRLGDKAHQLVKISLVSQHIFEKLRAAQAVGHRQRAVGADRGGQGDLTGRAVELELRRALDKIFVKALLFGHDPAERIGDALLEICRACGLPVKGGTVADTCPSG